MIIRIIPGKESAAQDLISRFKKEYPESHRDSAIKLKLVEKMWEVPLVEYYAPTTHEYSPGVIVEEDVEIGNNVIIEPGVYIHSGTKIGNNVIIETGTVIGGCGYGWVRRVSGELLLFPQIGGVIIEDNVHIGNNTCIDRGALHNTILRKGCKIDNLVHIAHNVDVGENAQVIAGAMVAGSVTIGKNCQIAPQASIMNQKTIGDNTLIGLHSCVTKDIPSNSVAYGVPAKVKE